jgi:protoporphyrinogen oxidase
MNMRRQERQNNNRKVLIIGGGPAGLTAAYQLAKDEVASVVFEKDDLVGGISRTVNYKNYHFDIGGHRFFTKVSRVEEFWKEILADELLSRNRLSRIYYNKRFFYYPLKPLNALAGLGIWSSFKILTSYIYAHLFPSKEEETFEQWVCNRFGHRLYQTFFKTYTEKVWGIPCSEIRAEWAAQRIKGLSLLQAIKSSLIKPRVNGDKKKVITTLIDRFDYPKYGPGMMWQAVANRIQANGGDVRMNADVEGIVWNGPRIEALEVRLNGKVERVEGTEFISSMPVQELIRKFKPSVPEEVRQAADNLHYRDFLTVALIVNKRDLFPDNWIYIHDPDVKLGRIQNFKNWSPYMVPDQQKTCLGLEYFCFEGDGLWTMPDADLIELGTRELEILGLVDGKDVEDGKVVRMPKAYPVYDSHYRESLQIIRDFLNSIENLLPIGRNGLHKYNNQDHSMLTAMLAVENIQGATHDLWEVNEEQEYHEEVKEVIPDELIIQTFSRMDKLGFATAIGSVCGLFVLVATLFLVFKGGGITGSNMQLISQYFRGYTVSLTGSFIGFAYSFAWGFLFGWLFAYLRNMGLAYYIYQVKRKAAMLSFRDFLDHY